MQAITSTVIAIAVVALILGAAVGYFAAPKAQPSGTSENTLQLNSQTFTPSEKLVKDQVTYLNEYLKEASSITGSPAPEIEYVSSEYDSDLGLIVVEGKEKTTSQNVTLYLTKNYKFVGYQAPVDLKSMVSELKQQKEEQEQKQEEVMQTLGKTGPYEGDEDAPVTVVVFDDFQCPFCGKFFRETLPKLRSDYIDTGKVKFVFKHFPLSFHQYAEKAAEAAKCAEEQGKFWEMHDKLYENQDALDVDSLKSYAADLGLDTEQFNDCLDSGKYADDVQSDFNEGVDLGVSGTPTFFINGEKLVGAQPYSVFQQVINSKLQEAQNQ